MRSKIIWFMIVLACLVQYSPAQTERYKIPEVAFKGKIVNLEIKDDVSIYVNGQLSQTGKIVFDRTGYFDIVIKHSGRETHHKVYVIHGLLTIIPPLITIGLALIFKEIIISLFIGILAGAFLLTKFDIIAAFFGVIDHYILEAVADKDKASIIIFTLLLGGMVGIISKSGGVKGIVESISRKVKSESGTQFYTWLMGILIFFDDYTNTLIVGNTMRPLTDKWKVSREKLAYLVDSTAAPIASIAVISTWIGFEISLIDQALKSYNVTHLDAYTLLLESLPYRFYSIISLIFIFLVFTMKRDFGPMLRAETRARSGKVLGDKAVPIADFESSDLSPSQHIKAKWYNGMIPIIMVILFTFGGLYLSGKQSLLDTNPVLAAKSFFSVMFSHTVIRDMGAIISAADSFKVLLWASMMGVFTSFFLSYTQKILPLKKIIDAFISGMRSMLMAIIILILAWSLGVVLVELNTADYLVSLLSANLDYHMLPAIVFVFSAFIAFATGTSWGTVAIMFPLMMPMVVILLRDHPDFRHFMVLTISSVLAGSVFGDHCSPISDTTIMSSLSSSCDHIDHVRTQLPYALTVAFTALLVCIIPVSYGFPYLLSFFGAIAVSFSILYFIGRKP